MRGDKTRFWEEVWMGDRCIEDLFPRLFYLSEQRGTNIENFGVCVDGLWEWRFV